MLKNATAELNLDIAFRLEYLKNPGLEALMYPLMDLTILKPDAALQSIVKHCEKAIELGCRSACVSPIWMRHVMHMFNDCSTNLCTVIGFPHGVQTAATKAFEAHEAVQNGATEIDFVQNVALVKSQDWKMLAAEYGAVRKVTNGVLVKVILETGLLTNEEIAACAKLAAECDIDMIKTSTGYGPRGASVEDIHIIAEALNSVSAKSHRHYGIKASGGIRTSADFLKMIQAGATRVGTSSALSAIPTVGY